MLAEAAAPLHPVVAPGALPAQQVPLPQRVQALGGREIEIAPAAAGVAAAVGARLQENGAAQNEAPQDFRSLRPFRHPPVPLSSRDLKTWAGVKDVTLDKLKAVALGVVYLFKYYVLTWGREAALVNQALTAMRSGVRGFSLQGEQSFWYYEFDKINKNRAMIGYFLGDQANGFYEFLDLIHMRLFDNEGRLQENQVATLDRDMQVLSAIMQDPIACEQVPAEQYEVLDWAHALCDGFELLQATCLELSLDTRVNKLLVFSALFRMYQDKEWNFEKFDTIIAVLQHDLSMTAAELHAAVEELPSLFEAHFRKEWIARFKAALQKEMIPAAEAHHAVVGREEIIRQSLQLSGIYHPEVDIR